MRTTTALLLAIVVLASCNQYQKTPSGFAYKITKGKGTEKLKQGQFVKFNVEFRIPPKDSVFNTSYGHIPGYLVVDTTRVSKHSFLEILPMLTAGDKVDFVLNVDTLKKMGALEYNNYFHQRDLIKGKLEILAVFTSQDAANADVQKEVEIEKQNEVKDLKAYVAKLGIKTQATASGALVEVVTPGDAQKADSGKQVKVMYKGTLTNGKQFDSNMDKNGPNNQPLNVNIGSNGGPGTVVKGLDEGLRVFGKGGKGRVFIPAMLAYGQNGQPPVIPAYANLVFEVEVIDVATPPAATPAAPAVPKK